LHDTSIHILDGDSLLNIFHLHRPFLFGEDKDRNIRLEGGEWAGKAGSVDSPTFVQDDGTTSLGERPTSYSAL
jgi:hypothetical protein